MADSSVQSVASAAPVLAVPARHMAAVEHPALLTSLAHGIDSMNGRADFDQILHPSSAQASIPVFLRYQDASSGAISSHNAASHNIVLAVHVPKRTGRKRKRGQDGPWEEAAAPEADEAGNLKNRLPGDELEMRDAKLLRRKLQDNAGRYETEVVGVVKHSHRFRGLADFQQSVHDSSFMAKFVDKIMPGDLAKLRQFELTPGIAAAPGVDLPPPPFFTSHMLPFPYFYTQNPFVREVSTSDGNVRLVNSTASAAVAGYLLGFDEEPVPTSPPPGLAAITGRRRMILDAMQRAVDERPVWTRRGLVNHMRAATGLPFTENRLKQYFAHVCYQFKGGPWRDSLVRYGVDPRKDPSCRQYQTVFFKLHYQEDRKGACWHSVRERDAALGETAADGAADNGTDKEAADHIKGVHIITPVTAEAINNSTATATTTTPATGNESSGPTRVRPDTHIFDGRSYCDDGKIWQVCDITDPLLVSIVADAPQRPTCELVSAGWFHHGTWAKFRAVMKTKLLAIRFGRLIDDVRYESSVSTVPHETPRLVPRSIKVPVPDLNLTPEEETLITHKMYHGRPKKRLRRRGYTSVSVPILATQRAAAATENGTKTNTGVAGGEATNWVPRVQPTDTPDEAEGHNGASNGGEQDGQDEQELDDDDPGFDDEGGNEDDEMEDQDGDQEDDRDDEENEVEYGYQSGDSEGESDAEVDDAHRKAVKAEIMDDQE
ncbi:transcription factor tau subunit sfc1 [Ophiostoma piceae UAMH 11346]|uniref:Transcription factor tau subunit sfc1 n=1 Tax=Ophiostoma piceae (strain UAMH 11346) TaxID=1262450 RepID=S3BWY9_OPHP1|nr:transcription factor tau subunit sfc1 [Ophiostoma piceae UAMH 11346]